MAAESPRSRSGSAEGDELSPRRPNTASSPLSRQMDAADAAADAAAAEKAQKKVQEKNQEETSARRTRYVAASEANFPPIGGR